jgi:hypothetical protein
LNGPAVQAAERLHAVRRTALGFAVAAIVLTVVPAAAASRGSPSLSRLTSAGKPAVVIVTAGKPSEYQFLLSRTSIKQGTVIFKINNLGKKPHSFGINGHTSKRLQPHQSTMLTVVFTKAERYVYSDTCYQNPNAAEQQGEGAAPTPCASGVLTVT